MTDSEIIKALACCGILGIKCDTKCPRYENDIPTTDTCQRDLIISAIDLINRQKAEIEALKLINSTYDTDTDRIRKIAIKEFAERIKARSYNTEFVTPVVDVEDIDSLVKEMVGE